MAFNYNSPAISNEALVDIEQIRENFLQLIKCHRGSAAPIIDSTHSAGMFWLYTPATGNWVLRQRNKDNNGWIDLWELTSSGVPAGHYAQSTATTTVHGARQGSGNGFDADKLDGKHLSDITGGGLITRNGLKTSTGSISGIGNNETYFQLQDYCFSPNIYADGEEVDIYLSCYYQYFDWSTTARFCLKPIYTPHVYLYGVVYQYITSSDKPFIYAIQKDGVILHVWECDDPPPGYWGLSEKPADFIPPISSSGINLEEAQEIVLFNYPMQNIKELRQRARGERKNFASLLRDYDYDHDKRLFIRKNLSQI
ncbi:MAG: hypothetical protein AB1847_11245 [bacterium]